MGAALRGLSGEGSQGTDLVGGKDEMDNYALLCSPCNGKKSSKLTLRAIQDERVKEECMNAEWWE